MKTLQEEWRAYRDAAYPTGAYQPQQEIECHQAFFAGALVYSQALDQIANLSEKDAMVALAKLRNEVWEINMARHQTVKDRN